LYVKNFPPAWTNATLDDVFGEYGDILSTKVLPSTKGTGRGIGFVCFEDKEDAQVLFQRDEIRFLFLTFLPPYVLFPEMHR